MPRADRILVIRLGAMGDVVRTLPAVKALREMYPGAHLTWLVEPSAASVVDAADVVDETMIFPRTDLTTAIRAGDGLLLIRLIRAFLGRLRRRRFEIVLDFHGLLKSGLLAWLSGAPDRYGYARGTAREGAHLFVNHRISMPRGRHSRYDRNAALVQGLLPPMWMGSACEDAAMPTRSGTLLSATPMAEARLAARLRVSSREAACGFVLIHPGTSAGATQKRYAPSAWADVARHLSEHGVEVWIVAGRSRDERNLVDQIVRASEGVARPAPETRSFDDLLALLGRASVFASADTGPLHAASLAGVPVVQLLGPTDPVENAPWRGTASRRVHVPLACAPCRRGCSAAPCMKVITPASVSQAILALREEGDVLASRADQGRG